MLGVHVPGYRPFSESVPANTDQEHETQGDKTPIALFMVGRSKHVLRAGGR